ncbi:MAG: hypothetical protein CL678_07080 [Bdellovibrionaceae bacterium]|nr:hypothetical protein [Pseudobdellovibrionaceae bacterium]
MRMDSFLHIIRSPWTVWVGRRYLSSKKSSRFLSFITFISVLGVSLGVCSIIVVLSVMDGFEGELKKRLMASDLHILIEPTRSVSGFDQGRVSVNALQENSVFEELKNEGKLLSLTSVLATEVILRSGRKVSGARVKGITQERLDRLGETVIERADPHLLKEWTHGEEVTLPGIYVGQEMAYQLGWIPGDRVTLISPTETQGPLSAIPRMKRFVIEGVYHSGMPDQEMESVFTLRSNVESFIRKRNVLTSWEIMVQDFDEAPEIARRLRLKLPNYRVKDWMEMNANLFASLKLERLAMFIMLTFIIVVASFNIVTTLTLMVLEKKKEIGILKAMGAHASQISAIFISEGLWIGFTGVFLGMGFALLLSLGLDRWEWVQLPDIYYDRNLPVSFDGSYYLLVGVATAIIVLLACLYPAKRAASLPPIDGLRG